jgi:serine/threonine-protein kinase RsbW
MATSAQCGHPRAQSVSQVPQAASGQAVTPDPDSGREAAGGQLLSSPAAGSVRGGWWERSFPGSTDQLTLLRKVLGSLLAGCPMADDVILLMSELGANAVRHSGSGKDGGTFTARLVDLPGEYILGVIEDGGSDWDGNLPRSARDASGLYLVLALSADCGVYGGQRKRAVWFRIQYPRRVQLS